MNRARLLKIFVSDPTNPALLAMLGRTRSRSSSGGGSSWPRSFVSALRDASHELRSETDKPATLTKAKNKKIVVKDIEPPITGWQVFTVPEKKDEYPNTFIIKFTNLKDVTLLNNQSGNMLLKGELLALTSDPRTIIFELPEKEKMSLNVLSYFKVLDSHEGLFRQKGGKLFFCTSNYETYAMLHNERFDVFGTLEEALEYVDFERGVDKTYLPGGGIVYTSP